jgi:hypothetical protein
MAQMKSARWATRDTGHVDLGGSALLFGSEGDPVGEYAVLDLTSRGALLTGEPWVRGARRRVHVRLALPSRAEPLEAWGHVGYFVDTDTGATEMELRFFGLSADDEDRIEEAILLEWARVCDT